RAAKSAGEPEERQEGHEPGGLGRSATGSLSRRPQPGRGQAMSAGGVRHLYVHLPVCASRCGYCDFVTLVRRQCEHRRYVDAVLAELELERGRLADEVETVFVGGGTPTFTEPAELRRLLKALPAGPGGTGEAHTETR